MTHNINTTNGDDTPPEFKWAIFSGSMILGVSIIGFAILQDNRYAAVSVKAANQVIKECKVARVEEIGSPSMRRPSRVRTVIELKDGSVMQTPHGTYFEAHQDAINDTNCPLETVQLQDDISADDHPYLKQKMLSE
jgi:hypothetical protein